MSSSYVFSFFVNLRVLIDFWPYYLKFKLRAVLPSDIKNGIKRPGHDAGVSLIFVPHHGEGLSRACLPVCKDANIVAIDDGLNQPANGNRFQTLKHEMHLQEQ